MEVDDSIGWVCDKDGTTMPHAASLGGSLQHGANEDAVDAENRSPLHWAGVCQGADGKQGCRDQGAGREGRTTFGEQGRPGLTAKMVGGNAGL